jgi:hypothetical protein
MKYSKTFYFLHVIAYSSLLVFITIGFFKAAQSQDAFKEYLKEDGLVEYLTAFFLLAISIVAFYRFFTSFKSARWKWALTWCILGLLFLFATGEEISWGQRIFHIQPSEYFMENNLQQEINFHNLVIGKIKINKLLFSQLLTAGLVFYLLFLRILTWKTRFFYKLVTDFQIPIPRWNHVIAMLISVILISLYNLMKTGELRELAFSMIFFLIFLYPAKITLNIRAKSSTQ